MKYNVGKKEKIISFLKENSKKSVTLSEICDAVTENGSGSSTVYRLVSELVASGCVERISDGRTRHCTYQYKGSKHCAEHLHLLCSECGKIIHLEEDLSEELGKRITESEHFTLDAGIVLRGKCEECVRGEGR